MTEKILKEISKRFNDGTETIEDIIKYCRNYEIKFENGLELRVVEKKYFDKLVKKIKELEEENKALELQNKQLEYYIEELKKYNKTVSDRIIEYKKNSISKQKIKEILDKAEVMDYYTLPDVIKDLENLLDEGE